MPNRVTFSNFKSMKVFRLKAAILGLKGWKNLAGENLFIGFLAKMDNSKSFGEKKAKRGQNFAK